MSRQRVGLTVRNRSRAQKPIRSATRGQHENEHNLAKLFDSLNEETKARLKELCPEVTDTVTKHAMGFVTLRYQFEELGESKGVKIPKPTDPLHGVAKKIAEALREESAIQEVVAAVQTGRETRGGTNDAPMAVGARHPASPVVRNPCKVDNQKDAH